VRCVEPLRSLVLGLEMDMRRRGFLSLLGGAVLGWPSGVGAQQSAVPVIGFLDGRSAESSAHLVTAFRRGLGEAGYAEGRNMALEYRWAQGQYDQLPALAADLVRQRVTVIATSGNAPTLAAKAAPETIPIVFVTGADPVQAGLVASLNRPGHNITGVTSLGVELGPKRLELLRELVPTAKRIALLANPANRTTEIHKRDAQAASQALGLELRILHASTEREIDAAFATLAELRVSALIIAPESFLNSRSEQLAALTIRHAMPAIFSYREFVAAGGLMSYGGSISDSYRQVGGFIGRILKGEKPVDLPVQQSTKAELFINLKTAKALGVTVPLALLGRANEVIE
jgi:putative ABC transport system substrate-binding protein